jgi:hypothetical protein
MGRVFSAEGYDGPPAWWEARQSRAAARRPACDEYGTPAEDESDGDESADGDSDDDAPEGEGGGE